MQPPSLQGSLENRPPTGLWKIVTVTGSQWKMKAIATGLTQTDDSHSGLN